MKDVNILINSGIDINKSLEVLGDMDMYDETLQDFLNEVDNKVNNLKVFKEKGDMSNYAIYAHSLKSDARYLGFTKLAEYAYNHEMESKALNNSYVNDHFDEFMNEVNRILTIVKTYVNGDEKNTNISSSSENTILIADDSLVICKLIEKMVGSDYKVIFASDGKEAIKIIDSNKDNLVGTFLDLNMPNVNGFEVLEYLKSNNLFEKVPVAIITGDDSKETIYKAFDYPIVDVLAKPFNENDVQRIITAMKNFL